MNNNFKSFIMEFIQNHPGKRVAIAVSGGADSIVLLHWVAAMGIRTIALTVDHGLRPESEDEALFAKSVARSLGIEHFILKWSGDKPATGVEEAARDARYGLMFDFCRQNNIEILMTAHHADDNIETFLMNLGRGSGLFGLAGMRQVSMRGDIMIVRPLLQVSGAEIRDWCVKNGVEFANDPMNDDENFLRVRIRKNRHFLADSLGISDNRILSAISALDKARAAAENSIDRLLNSVEQVGNRVKFSADFLFELPVDSQLRFLGRVLQSVGGEKYTPRLNSLQNLIKGLQNDTTMTLGKCAVRRLGNRVLIVPEGDSVSFGK